MNQFIQNYLRILSDLAPYNASLVAVSKHQPVELIRELYDAGHRDFGENYVQECCHKHEMLAENLRWHFIGHLQSNKVKQIIPFITLIHGIDSRKLITETDKQAGKIPVSCNVLLQIHIAQEESKFGFSQEEALELFTSGFFSTTRNLNVVGLMGMASNTNDTKQIGAEFRGLKQFFDSLCVSFPDYTKNFNVLSMGMTSDYKIALEEGSTMVRIGSALFGERKK